MVFIGGEHSSQVESTKLWWQLPHDWLCLHRYLPPSTISLFRLFDCCDIFCVVVVVFHVIIVVVWGQCAGSAHHLLNHNRLCPHQPPAAKSLFAFANVIVVLVAAVKSLVPAEVPQLWRTPENSSWGSTSSFDGEEEVAEAVTAAMSTLRRGEYGFIFVEFKMSGRCRQGGGVAEDGQQLD